jgi:hypothetical protein
MEQVAGIVFGVQVPGLAFAVLAAEFAHVRPPSRSKIAPNRYGCQFSAGFFRILIAF